MKNILIGSIALIFFLFVIVMLNNGDEKLLEEKHHTNKTTYINAPAIKPKIKQRKIKSKQLELACKEKNERAYEIDSWKYKVEEELKNLLSVFDADALTKIQREQIVQSANIPLYEYRKMAVWHTGTDMDSYRTITGRATIPKAIYYQYLEEQNYLEIAAMVERGEISNQTIGLNESVLAHMVLYGKNISTSDIEMMLNNGLSPSYFDLVRLTEMNAPTELIGFLVNYTTENINQLRYNHYKNYTLTMSAVENNNLELFNYWVSKSVPFSSGEDDFTAIDLLAKPNSQDELSNAIDIFKVLANNNVKPYDMKTIIDLKEWLPVDIQKEFSEYFKNNQVTELPYIDESIRKTLMNLSVYFHAIKEMEAEDSLCSSKAKPMQVAEIDDNENTNNSDQPDQYKEQTKRFTNSLRIAILEGDWNSYLKSADAFFGDTGLESIYGLSLLQAIQNNAPMSVIDQLLERGAEVPFNAILILTINKNLTLTKKLMPHGLDLHYRDPQNKNAIFYGVNLSTSKEMFRFLLGQNVSVYQSVDLLENLLKIQLPNAAFYVEQLIANGFKITPMHVSSYRRLEKRNPRYYETLRPIFEGLQN